MLISNCNRRSSLGRANQARIKVLRYREYVFYYIREIPDSCIRVGTKNFVMLLGLPNPWVVVRCHATINGPKSKERLGNKSSSSESKKTWNFEAYLTNLYKWSISISQKGAFFFDWWVRSGRQEIRTNWVSKKPLAFIQQELAIDSQVGGAECFNALHCHELRTNWVQTCSPTSNKN